MFARQRGLELLLAVGLLAGCATPGGPPRATPLAAELAGAIQALGDRVEQAEAQRAAGSLVAATEQLRLRYRMVRPPQLHNLFVNLGLRERGLCCHFAEDLIAGLLELELETLEVHWVVARHGSRLREHSSVLLVPGGGGFRDGLVVDAWRRAGELYWTRVGDDRYPWQLHPMSGDWERLHCSDS